MISQGLALRPETQEDIPFLEALYLSVRWEGLAQTGWTDEMKRAFLAQQFAAQRNQYVAESEGSSFDIITLNGEPVGRLYVRRTPVDYRIVDISLLPSARGQGFGTILLQSVLDEAMQAGKPVTLHVAMFNPARRLYLRLGFVPARHSEPYEFMIWTPPGGDS